MEEAVMAESLLETNSAAMVILWYKSVFAPGAFESVVEFCA